MAINQLEWKDFFTYYFTLHTVFMVGFHYANLLIFVLRMKGHSAISFLLSLVLSVLFFSSDSRTSNAASPLPSHSHISFKRNSFKNMVHSTNEQREPRLKVRYKPGEIAFDLPGTYFTYQGTTSLNRVLIYPALQEFFVSAFHTGFHLRGPPSLV